MGQRPNFRPNQPLIEFLGIPGLDEGMDQEILEISELRVDYRKGLRHTQDMTTTQTPNTAAEIKVYRVRTWHGYDAKWEWVSEIRCDGRHIQGFGPFNTKAEAKAAAETA